MEFLWPNASGRHFPTNTRWLDVLPAEGRVWTPSLYLGLLPFVLALTSFSLRRTAAPITRWLSWLTLLSALAGMGVFGLLWWLREIAGWFGGSLGGIAGDEVGGLYWLMTVVLPGYVYFRYPAKLLVVTSLGLSMLAAIGWDRLRANRSPRWWRFFALLAVASGAACLAVSLAWPALLPRLQTIAPNELFGPFDAAHAKNAITQSLLHTAALSLLLAAVLRGTAALLAPGESPGAKAQLAVLVLTALDLIIAGNPLVQYAPTDAWQNHTLPPALQNRTKRLYRDPQCWNSAWRDTGSPHRLLENLDWEQATLFPKYNLPREIALAESKGTLSSFDIEAFWDIARDHAGPNGSPPDPSVLQLAGVSHVIAPDHTRSEGTRLTEGVSLFTLPESPRRAWIVHEVVALGELQNPSSSAIRQRTEEILFPRDRTRDWSREAVIESDGKLPAILPPAGDAPPERCAIIADEAQRVEIEVRLASPGLVVLADAYDPGWALAVETDGVTRDAAILRTNRVLRGVMLPAGHHRLVFRYRPVSFYLGAATTGAALLALVTIAAITWRKESPGRAGG
jgi:hypothetical protein